MKISRSEKFAKTIIYMVFIIASISCIVPFILTFIVSISTEQSVLRNGYSFFPTGYSLDAYKVIFKDNMIWQAYGVSIFVTIVGTCISTICSALAGYSMSLKRVKYRNVASMFFYIPMVFQAGLVPWYLVVVQTLHLRNTIWALILPGIIMPFNIFLFRNFFKSIPGSLAESAEIDGATPLVVFFKIIVPLSTPIFATVGLFVSLSYWNDWVLALWFIDKKELFPLQYLLYSIESLIAYMQSTGSKVGSNTGAMPTQTVQVATLFVTIGPIILAYPFVQKYFVKGIMVGSVKG